MIKIILGLEEKLQVLDNNIRWNSTWLMLYIACYYKTCWPRYAEDDPAFSHFVPTECEWEIVQEICRFLELFADVIEVINGSYYPTVNLFINELWKVKILLDENAIKYEKSHLRLMALEMQLKYDKYWRECDTLIALIAILLF
ncbi:hypothetical protein LIER_24344 [Lithospermum erythrorhizon]|uniref:hAT-like transposase RNase-H fold domain-containing protein n=1 Tax=Lithospermum erythrorhizon TaxID=34254 RepID=A0AAV3R2Z2_LITER